MLVNIHAMHKINWVMLRQTAHWSYKMLLQKVHENITDPCFYSSIFLCNRMKIVKFSAVILIEWKISTKIKEFHLHKVLDRTWLFSLSKFHIFCFFQYEFWWQFVFLKLSKIILINQGFCSSKANDIDPEFRWKPCSITTIPFHQRNRTFDHSSCGKSWRKRIMQIFYFMMIINRRKENWKLIELFFFSLILLPIYLHHYTVSRAILICLSEYIKSNSVSFYD